MTSFRRFSLLYFAIRVRTAAIAVVMAGAATLASAAPPAAAGNNSFLALGDSVVFGYIEQAGYAYVNPNNFIGYPDYVGGELRLDTADAACPGETTSSFISSTGADNGCRPFRSNFPLHVAYTSTQLDFATTFLANHRQTRLVTIGLGANDVFLLQDSCAGDIGCIETGLPAVLTTVVANMDKILGRVRATGFRGVLIVVNYYSLDYTDPGANAVVRNVLNNVKGGSIVSLHLGHSGTVTALPRILSGLHAHGLTPVTVSTLLKGTS